MHLAQDREQRLRNRAGAAEDLLAQLADPARPSIEAHRIAIVTAHPDDETLGCGAQLPRLRGAMIVCVTDGAPRNFASARERGFSDPVSYTRARQAELRAALAGAGVAASALVELMVADQGAAFELPALARRIAQLFVDHDIGLALTHAYEGGHPDHDATAFAVHVASRLLARGAHPLEIVEMPFYRLGPSGPLLQSFPADEDGASLTIPLRPDERLRKGRMVGAHVTQRAVLSQFSLDAERFRRAPPYDFTQLPNDGRLLYEQHPWGMCGGRWLALADHALRALGLRR